MCNRYAFIADAAMRDLLSKLGVFMGADLQPRYNIAPTNLVPAVRATAKGNRLEMMRWGLIPHWAKHDTKVTGFTNARSETLTEKPAFRQSFKYRRCLIPASGFFEWKKEGKIKQPHYFYRKDEQPMLFAGISEAWVSPDSKPLDTCAIITTTPNELVAPIHDRMPVILPWEIAPFWLDPVEQNQEKLLSLLQPLPADRMAMHRVSTLVNSSTIQGYELIAPESSAGLLFVN